MTRSTELQGVRWLLPSTYAALVGAIFLVAAARPAHAGVNVWTSHGPYGGDVVALAIDPTTPSTLYAGTLGGCGVMGCGRVFKSTNGGSSWSWVGPGGLYVNALAIDPTTPSRLYAGTPAGVFDLELPCLVGTGTSASCTEAALDACLPGGADFNGAVTFECGPEPVTMTVTSTKVIAQDTTIDGGGLITISGGDAVGVLDVPEGATLELRNLTIADGGGGAGPPDGGAVRNQGIVTVHNCGFVRNYAGWGGAISNLGILTIAGSVFSENRAAGGSITSSSGGAIVNVGTVTVASSTFSANSAEYGGAIHNVAEPATMQLTGVTLRGNSAVYGGGAIANGTASLRVTNSTLADNSAGPDFAGGGGIDNGRGTVAVSNCTLSGNSAGGVGDAISNRGSVTLMNTIISGPSESNCYNYTAPVIDGGHNLQFPGTDCGDTIASFDPLLDPAGLQDNGGPTQTIALLPGSPAIDTGDPEVCASPPVNGVDQRGYMRPGEGSTNCSIGAYEYDASEPLLCNGDCNGDGEITVDEVITGINIALGNISVCTCMPCDTDDNGVISIAELMRAVSYALSGCPFWNGGGGDPQGSAVAWIESMRNRCEEREGAVR